MSVGVGQRSKENGKSVAGDSLKMDRTDKNGKGLQFAVYS